MASLRYRDYYIAAFHIPDQSDDVVKLNLVQTTRPETKPAAAAARRTVCADCRHGHCTSCEEASAARQFSNYWIGHCCCELNRRA